MKIGQWLGFLGLSPFIICLALPAFYTRSLSVEPQHAFIFYSAIILSFLSGTLWQKETLICHPKVEILSNVFCLSAFLALLLPLSYALFVLSLGYISMLFTEYLLTKNKAYALDKTYLKMRTILTFLVILLHAIAAILWF